MKLFIASCAPVVIGAVLMLWITLPHGAHARDDIEIRKEYSMPHNIRVVQGHDDIRVRATLSKEHRQHPLVDEEDGALIHHELKYDMGEGDDADSIRRGMYEEEHSPTCQVQVHPGGKMTRSSSSEKKTYTIGRTCLNTGRVNPHLNGEICLTVPPQGTSIESPPAPTPTLRKPDSVCLGQEAALDVRFLSWQFHGVTLCVQDDERKEYYGNLECKSVVSQEPMVCCTGTIHTRDPQTYLKFGECMYGNYHGLLLDAPPGALNQ